jgi:iron(III) transport system substrate-binding protein
MPNPLTRRPALSRTVPAVIAAALLLAACSSSGGGGSTSSSAAPATSGGGSSAGGSSAAGSTAAAPASADAACTAATNQDGGKLDFWAASDPDVFQKEIAPFQKEHPNIHISYTSMRPPDITQRLVAEAQAGHKPTTDAIIGDLSSLAPAFQKGLFLNTDLNSYGIPKDRQVTFDGVNVWRVYRDPQGIVYNTSRVSAGDVPKNWNDLINSKWANQIIVDPSADYVDNLALGMGQATAINWLKSLLKTAKPVLLPGATASVTKVVSGENAITTSATYSAFEAQKVEGAPIQIAFLNFVPTFDYYGEILKGAAHVDAAECFYSWYSGPEAAAQLLKYEYKQTADTPKNLPAGSKVYSITTPAQAATITDTQNQMAKLLTQ